MSVRSRFGLEVLLAAVIAGIAGNALLREVDWALNLSIWIVSLGLIAAVLFFRAKRLGLMLTSKVAVAMAGVALLFGIGFVWRDSPGVRTANLIAIIAALGIPLVNRGPMIVLGSWRDYSSTLIGRWLSLPGDAYKLYSQDVEWSLVGGTMKRWNIAAISRGLLFALPLVLLFGGLFSMADSSFERLITPKVSFDFVNAVWGTYGILAFTLVSAGLFRRFFLSNEPKAPPVLTKSTFGITEWTIALGALNALFAVFAAIQIKHFSTSIQVAAQQGGLSVAQYVRQGFFELVVAAGLLLPLLLSSYTELSKQESCVRRYRILTLGLVGMMFVVIFSAMHRMWLHVQIHGLTELRIYSTVFLGWLTLVFVWFLVTVWNKRPQRFAFGAAVAGFASILGLNLMNPDAMIARTNLRAADCDYSYVSSLSADAVPDIMAAMDGLGQIPRETIRLGLTKRWSEPEPDWRAWNISRGSARALFRAKGLDKALVSEK